MCPQRSFQASWDSSQWKEAQKVKASEVWASKERFTVTKRKVSLAAGLCWIDGVEGKNIMSSISHVSYSECIYDAWSCKAGLQVPQSLQAPVFAVQTSVGLRAAHLPWTEEPNVFKANFLTVHPNVSTRLTPRSHQSLKLSVEALVFLHSTFLNLFGFRWILLVRFLNKLCILGTPVLSH